MRADADTICAGLLHDTLEDTDITKEIIINEFNEEIYKLVEGVTKIKNTDSISTKEAQLASIRKLVVSITEDIRIIIIKLADRLDNMRSLSFMSPEKQNIIATTTKEIYIPLAEKIGAYQIQCELEDLSFKYLHPNEYYEIQTELDLVKQEALNILLSMAEKISELLKSHNIPHQIKTKIKNIYEIYKRKINKDMRIFDVPNILNIKIIVNDYRSCYETLGWIHSLYQSVDALTRFYITNPQYPMHRAIHSTILGEDDKLIQTQIQTLDMNLLSTYGLTAFWQMSTDDVRNQMQQAFRDQFSAYDSLREIDSMISNNFLFFERIKKEILMEDITVFTPKAEKIKLPIGSSVIDFAYHIHNDLGNHLVSVRINDMNESIFYRLRNYDRVRILTDFDSISCDVSWLDHVQTLKAQKGIKEGLKQKEANQVLSLNHL